MGINPKILVLTLLIIAGIVAAFMLLPSGEGDSTPADTGSTGTDVVGQGSGSNSPAAAVETETPDTIVTDEDEVEMTIKEMEIVNAPRDIRIKSILIEMNREAVDTLEIRVLHNSQKQNVVLVQFENKEINDGEIVRCEAHYHNSQPSCQTRDCSLPIGQFSLGLGNPSNLLTKVVIIRTEK